ncbi:cutinase family protein [Williamsia maris]|uniref:Cellulase n=1 Tax=Williamsia maris TaxID=72806 RepID=A0ABT1HDL3_9NOCA|nr:cutinase family protein [Williamsia maris]MCP2176269.1 Cutinase [Williamsia maris]
MSGNRRSARGRTAARKPRRRKLVLFGILGVVGLAIVAIILVVILVITIMRPGPTGPGRGPGAPSSTSQRPTAQPADCPDVQTIVIPGTLESSATDDPYNPTANPNSLMLKVSRPLGEQFPSSRADVYTVPYVAQFRNPTNLADRQVDYNVSRAQGNARAKAKMTEVNQRCPLTGFVLMGFSQGAVIAGDIASDIGNGRGPVAQDLVLGVGLIADGRRQKGEANDVGPSPDGVGAEIALGGFGTLVPGIAMTGARAGGFGDVKDRTYAICASGDLICDSPTILNPLDAIGKIAGALNNPVHALYNTTRYWDDDGASATRWMYGWARSTIEKAPRPEHN